MTAEKLATAMSEIVAQECGCVPLWENRPMTSMQIVQIRRRVDDLLADAWTDALSRAQQLERCVRDG